MLIQYKLKLIQLLVHFIPLFFKKIKSLTIFIFYYFDKLNINLVY